MKNIKLLPISEQAMQNINQFKDNCTPEQFTKIEKAIIELNWYLVRGNTFCQTYGRKLLEDAVKLDLPNFLETLKYLPK